MTAIKKSIWVLYPLVLFLVSGCASAPLAPKNIQDAVRQFSPPSNKSYIYIIRPSRMLLNGVFVTAQVDHRHGTLGNGQFLFFEVESNRIHEAAVNLVVPSPRSSTEGLPTAVQIDALPGQSYFLLAWITSVSYEIELQILPDEEGRGYVKQLDMVADSDRPSGL